MPSNLVSTNPSRFNVIRPELLSPMAVLEKIDTEALITQRMNKVIEIWASHDPPNAAQYDVGALEFDPIRINQELNAYFELLVRDRVNQACRAITLAFAVGSDLDAIGSRYPYGMPRMAGENDESYRRRIWLSPNILSLSGTGQGTFESYVFWALSAPMFPGDVPLKHASALTKPYTGNVYLPILSSAIDNPDYNWSISIDRKIWTLFPGTQPVPTSTQVEAVFEYITAPDTARKGLTDVINILPPKVAPVLIDVQIWLFNGIDRDTLMAVVAQAVADLIEGLRWLGADLTLLTLSGALAQAGVYNTKITSPAADVIVDIDGVVNVISATLRYMGQGE
jgi:phage-related baseplate assembly protein